MAEQPEHFVNLSDGRVHFRYAGPDDGRTVILIHGFSYASWSYNFLGPLLVEAGYRVFALDLYGRGFSDRPRVPHDRGLYNRMLAEFLDAVEIDEPVTFVGNSMGGGVVTDFAAHHPGQVRALLLLVPAGLRLSAPMSLGWLGVPVIGDLIWRWVGPGLAQAGSKIPKVRTMADAAMAQQAAIPGYYRSLLSTLRHYPLDGLQASFEAVSVQGTPVAALFAEDDDLIPIEAADVLQAAIPKAVIERIEGVSHDLVMEQPERVLAALEQLLSRS